MRLIQQIIIGFYIVFSIVYGIIYTIELSAVSLYLSIVCLLLALGSIYYLYRSK